MRSMCGDLGSGWHVEHADVCDHLLPRGCVASDAYRWPGHQLQPTRAYAMLPVQHNNPSRGLSFPKRQKVTSAFIAKSILITRPPHTHIHTHTRQCHHLPRPTTARATAAPCNTNSVCNSHPSTTPALPRSASTNATARRARKWVISTAAPSRPPTTSS
jgi:hypothetical protein